MTLVLGVWIGILVVWRDAPPESTRIATLALIASVAATAAAAWYTHLLGREPGHNFLYLHVVFDVALVTTIVHITGGEPTFVPTYILVITEGALLLPLPGGMLIGALASIVYFADYAWLNAASSLSGEVLLQILLFALVALITGWLGDRVRQAGLTLGAVQSELTRLRLNTDDILGSISTGVMSVDGHGRLAYMNGAAEEMLGLHAEEWEGAPVLDAVEAVSQGLASIVRRTIESRVPAKRFKSLATSNDRELTLGVGTTVLERDGEESLGVTAIFQDITDLERLELLNRRNERLEAVAELSASLAHEIKNPLASIRSSVEQLAGRSLGHDDREVLEGLILNETDRLSRLLTDFLEFSVIKLKSQDAVDFTTIVCDGVSLARQHPEAEGAASISVEGIDKPLLIPGDADLLHRLVFNLVLNAIHFAGSEGTVRVFVEDRADRPGPLGLDVPRPVRLRVEDSGPGIPPDRIDKIFDPFFTTREGGSGLGLALVHRAVEAHGGALFVERSSDGGAAFVIYLPGEPPEPVTGAKG